MTVPGPTCNDRLSIACRTLRHLPASLLELDYDWDYDAAIHPLNLAHLTALTKLTTGVCGRALQQLLRQSAACVGVCLLGITKIQVDYSRRHVHGMQWSMLAL